MSTIISKMPELDRFLGVSLISLILKIELKNNGNIFLKYNGINAFVRSPEHGHIPIDKKHTDML